MSRPAPFAPKRPTISKKRRAEIFAAHGGICWLCKGKIGAGEDYDIDHQVARQLGGADAEENLAPAHKYCHAEKTKLDIAMIAKAKRIARDIDPETRKTPKRRIPHRKQPWPSRPFQKREKMN